VKKTLTLFLLAITLTMSACTRPVTATPKPLPATKPAALRETDTPMAVSPTQVDPTATRKQYTNAAFGLGFQFPSNWFGPDEYISDQTLRVAVGSDVVYPYGGQPPEKPSDVKNSYNIVIQYTKLDQNSDWKENYQTLTNLKDGESLSGARSLITRVRQLGLGKYKGFEYIATLSETAQTEPVYSRGVILVDAQSDLLTMLGTPNNVEITGGGLWRDAYRMIDQANVTVFHEILDSMTIQ
jgi:hypothetical protein